MEIMARIYPNVSFGPGSSYADFVVIGEPSKGKAPGEIATIFGARALIRSHTVIYAGARFGDDFQSGHGALIREGVEIGNNVKVGGQSIIEYGARIADNVSIHANVHVAEHCVVEEGAWLAPQVILSNARYPRSKNSQGSWEPVVVGRRAKIGCGTIVLPGVKIGENALIGAASIITKDVPANAVVAGTPGRLLRYITEIPEYDTTAE